MYLLISTRDTDLLTGRRPRLLVGETRRYNTAVCLALYEEPQTGRGRQARTRPEGEEGGTAWHGTDEGGGGGAGCE